jgi:hypothetical protein
MNEDGPNGSPYETLAKHDQSETKCDNDIRVVWLACGDGLHTCARPLSWIGSR